MPSFPTLTARAIFFIVGLLVLIGVVAFTVRSCDKRHSRAAQTRVERSQAEAAANSAAIPASRAAGLTAAFEPSAARICCSLIRVRSSDALSASPERATVPIASAALLDAASAWERSTRV
jgi:hypothetical protein